MYFCWNWLRKKPNNLKNKLGFSSLIFFCKSDIFGVFFGEAYFSLKKTVNKGLLKASALERNDIGLLPVDGQTMISPLIILI